MILDGPWGVLVIYSSCHEASRALMDKSRQKNIAQSGKLGWETSTEAFGGFSIHHHSFAIGRTQRCHSPPLAPLGRMQALLIIQRIAHPLQGLKRVTQFMLEIE